MFITNKLQMYIASHGKKTVVLTSVIQYVHLLCK